MRVITECRTSTRTTHNLFECEMTNYPNKHGDKAQRQTHGGAEQTNTHSVCSCCIGPHSSIFFFQFYTSLPISSCRNLLLAPHFDPLWLYACSMFFYSPDCSSDPSSRFSRGGNLGDILIPNTGRNAEQRPNDHNPTSHSRMYI